MAVSCLTTIDCSPQQELGELQFEENVRIYIFSLKVHKNFPILQPNTEMLLLFARLEEEN